MTKPRDDSTGIGGRAGQSLDQPWNRDGRCVVQPSTMMIARGTVGWFHPTDHPTQDISTKSDFGNVLILGKGEEKALQSLEVKAMSQQPSSAVGLPTKRGGHQWVSFDLFQTSIGKVPL